MTSVSKPKLSRSAWIAIAVVAVVVLGLVGWRVVTGKPKVVYATAPASVGLIARSVSGVGALQALVTVEVGSQASGQIRKITVDFSDQIPEGQPMAILDPHTYQTRLAQAQADIVQARVELGQAVTQAAEAKTDYDRKKARLAQGKAARSELEDAKAVYDVSVADIQSAKDHVADTEAALAAMQVDLARTQIIAPIDGMVVDRDLAQGQITTANPQAPVIFRIAEDITRVQIKLAVAEADVGQVHVGQTVKLTVDAFPGDKYRGVVTQIGQKPVTDASGAITYAVLAEAPNPDGKLQPGMTAKAAIAVELRPKVLRIPTDALSWNPDSAAQAQGGAPGGPPGAGAGGGPGGGQGGGGQRGGMAGQKLVEQLGLNPDQQKTWAGIQSDMRAKMADVMASAGGDRDIIRQQMRKNMGEALAKLEPILTPAQQRKLVALRAAMSQGRPDREGFTAATVYVLRGGKPVAVHLRAGVTDGDLTEIRGPLKPGDLVITGTGGGGFGGGAGFGGAPGAGRGGGRM